MQKSFVDWTLKIAVVKIGAVVVACSMVCWSSVLQEKNVFAHPSDSPSAQAAARLKHNPLSNWLRHYLPDDRYKIAGGTWKVVSTEAEGFYHRPDCRQMLKGNAGSVIGFASADDAEEVGYRPDGICRPQVPGSSTSAATTGSGNARRNGKRLAAPVSNNHPPAHRDGFSATVATLAASIARTSTTRDLQRLERGIERLKAGYIGQGDGDRAVAVDWLLVAVQQKAAWPNPIGLSSWRNSLRAAQFAADEVSRKAAMTPDEAERDQERFNRRLMQEALSAVKNGPSRR